MSQKFNKSESMDAFCFTMKLGNRPFCYVQVRKRLFVILLGIVLFVMFTRSGNFKRRERAFEKVD